MEGVDISQFSEEEQRILRNVFARAQDEEERDKIKFRSVHPPLFPILLPHNSSLRYPIPVPFSVHPSLWMAPRVAMAAPESGQAHDPYRPRPVHHPLRPTLRWGWLLVTERALYNIGNTL
ncbi:hypothetical protein TNIN_116951 [Trichonephila inaurata madagascariensis]|uniref:Uncharacterized protein n=1 Tax=Trichonephila inaurata madagascariensis TaxID=2747483 RepID=A0A8X6YFE7_9ARAC|nr:hypothetical protein TNIN_116951 [Trichonephila inaurata madagascariensis]